MPLTRSFKDTIAANAQNDPEFRIALLTEAIEVLLSGDFQTGKAVLRDYINATLGFNELSARTGTPAKSLMRMFSPSGNPTARTLFAIISDLQKDAGLALKLKRARRMFDEEALLNFYDSVSNCDGVPVEKVATELKMLFELPRSQTDLDNFRMGKKPWKKLHDEICPLLHFLKSKEMNQGRVSFPLNDKVPDCWYWPPASESPVGIEVTIAQGRERIELAKELIDKGAGRGFIGLPDDAPKASFEKARSRPRVMYSSHDAIHIVKKAIDLCLLKKNKSRYQDIILVVQAPLGLLPTPRWSPMAEELKKVAASLPFNEIYLIGDRESSSQIFKLK